MLATLLCLLNIPLDKERKKVRSIGVDRDATAAGQHDVDTLPAQMLGNKGSEFADGHFTQGLHRGFPFRLGLRLLARSAVRTSSG